MARPRSDTVDYFSHDTNASSKKTLTILEGQFGIGGYAFWFKLLEWLGNTEGFYYDARNPQNLEFLVRKCGFSLQVGSEILDKLSEMQAIDSILWQHKIIWSQHFVDRLADVYKKRNRNLPEKPCFCNGKCNHTDINTIIPVPITAVFEPVSTQSKVKESKVNKRKYIKEKTIDEIFSNTGILEYIDNFRNDERFINLDINLEIDKFKVYWSENGRKLKNPKTAIFNWLVKAIEYRKNGQNKSSNQQNGDEVSKYTQGKYGHIVKT